MSFEEARAWKEEFFVAKPEASSTNWAINWSIYINNLCYFNNEKLRWNRKDHKEIKLQSLILKPTPIYVTLGLDVKGTSQQKQRITETQFREK